MHFLFFCSLGLMILVLLSIDYWFVVLFNPNITGIMVARNAIKSLTLLQSCTMYLSCWSLVNLDVFVFNNYYLLLFLASIFFFLRLFCYCLLFFFLFIHSMDGVIGLSKDRSFFVLYENYLGWHVQWTGDWKIGSWWDMVQFLHLFWVCGGMLFFRWAALETFMVFLI